MCGDDLRLYAKQPPLFSEMQVLIPVLSGMSTEAIRSFHRALAEQEWIGASSDPDKWIRERLQGEDATTAKRLWEGTTKKVDPKRAYSYVSFIIRHGLMTPDFGEVLVITERGQRLLDGDATTIHAIERAEKLPELLALLATKGRVRVRELVHDWIELLGGGYPSREVHFIRHGMRGRMKMLADRGLVCWERGEYFVTAQGFAYLDTLGAPNRDLKREALHAANLCNGWERRALRELLLQLPPEQFRALITSLMRALGYNAIGERDEVGAEDIRLLAMARYGISTAYEVVQVKRQENGLVYNATIDELRGSLACHRAVRGTLITLGGMSKGAAEAALSPGAIPITLIDGDRLLDLLIKHGIGIRKRAVELYELDTDSLSADETAESEENEDEPL